MIDARKPAQMGKSDNGRMVSRRDSTGRQPHADVRRPTTASGGNVGRAAKAGNKGANIHGVGKLPSALAKNKPRGANDIDVNADPFHPRVVGRRLKILRRTFQMGTMAEAAKSVGIAGGRWANWEAGIAIPPAHMAQQITVAYPDFCLNYLYLGSFRNVSFSLAQVLRQETARLDSEQQRRAQRIG